MPMLAVLSRRLNIALLEDAGQGLGTTFDKVDTNVRAAPATSVDPSSGVTLPGGTP